MKKTGKDMQHPSVSADKTRMELIKVYREHEKRPPAQQVRIITSSQELGRSFAHELVLPGDDDVVCRRPGGPREEGTRIVVSGRVLNEDSRPVRKALIEVWQANCRGKYEHPDDITPAPPDPNLKAFGRMLTADEGSYRFRSIKPG